MELTIKCPHLRGHKKTRQKFISVDVFLSLLALIYIFCFAQSNIWFSFAVLVMVLSFNGYALYSYRQIDVKHREIELEEKWCTKWTQTRFFICFFEWLLYFTYLLVIGPSVYPYHWILFAIGIILIAIAYYELEKLEHEIGIYSLAVEANQKTVLVLKDAGLNV